MTNTRKAVQLVGETLRDIGILLLVFGPLDATFQANGRGADVAGSLVLGGLFLIGAGIIIESLTESSR